VLRFKQDVHASTEMLELEVRFLVVARIGSVVISPNREQPVVVKVRCIKLGRHAILRCIHPFSKIVQILTKTSDIIFCQGFRTSWSVDWTHHVVHNTHIDRLRLHGGIDQFRAQQERAIRLMA